MEHAYVLVHLAPFLTEMLSFAKSTFLNPGVFITQRMVHIDLVNAICIYCDAIEHRIFGHNLAPLLGVASVDSQSESIINKRYDRLQYTL